MRAEETSGILGAGIGPYLVQEVARANGDDIYCDPEAGSARSIEIRLPAADAAL